jgi:alkylation response protein AidB-like acyl-CoA dehydrogenase
MATFDSDDIRLLADSVAGFLRERPMGDSDADAERQDRAWRDMAALGWLGVIAAETDGGFDGGAVALAAIARGLGEGLLTAPFLSTAVFGAGLLGRAGSPEHKATLLPRVLAGDLVVAFADREPGGGHERSWVRTLARESAAGLRLSGRKQFVVDAPLAEAFIVTAKGSRGGDLGLFVVSCDTPGVRQSAYRTVDGRWAADLEFDDVGLDAGARLPGPALEAIEAVYALATLAACAEACGAASALNAHTLAHLKTRSQFGALLGGFQALQHRMADMWIDEHEMMALTTRASALHDAGLDGAGAWVAAAKATAARCGRRIAEAAVQLHGGMGMAEELPIGRYLRRILLLSTLFGDEAWQLDQLDAATWPGAARPRPDENRPATPASRPAMSAAEALR